MSDPRERWLETGRLAELGLLSAELVHEVRQPVFAIKALAELMRLRAAPADRAALDLMLDQVRALETVIDRYAGSGRRPAGGAGPTLLGPAVEAGALLLSSRARGRGLQLDVQISPDAVLVRCDPVAVQQITTNLVQNAVDAARSRVEVVASQGVLAISDDGPGLPSDIEAHLYEPFHTTKPPGCGTGLGLAIVRHLVEAAGASIGYDSGPQGTRFVVTFAGAAGDAREGSPA